MWTDVLCAHIRWLTFSFAISRIRQFSSCFATRAKNKTYHIVGGNNSNDKQRGRKRLHHFRECHLDLILVWTLSCSAPCHWTIFKFATFVCSNRHVGNVEHRSCESKQTQKVRGISITFHSRFAGDALFKLLKIARMRDIREWEYGDLLEKKIYDLNPMKSRFF